MRVSTPVLLRSFVGSLDATCGLAGNLSALRLSANSVTQILWEWMVQVEADSHQRMHLATAIAATWEPQVEEGRFVVCTGGEPLLQLDRDLTEALHTQGFKIAIETNGTRPLPDGVDWVCVSPKAGADLELRSGDELKLVYPQIGAEPEAL